jgi:hypothetical protein
LDAGHWRCWETVQSATGAVDLAAVIYALLVTAGEGRFRPVVYAWELWKKRDERVREALRPILTEELVPVLEERLRKELRQELRQWIREGGNVEDWLNGHGQTNGAQPDRP